MNSIHVLLILLIIIFICFCSTFLFVEPVDSHGVSHPSIEKMQAGGDAKSRIEGMETIVLFFQAATLSLLTLLITMGISPQYKTKKFWCGFGSVWLASLWVWWNIFTGYFQFLNTNVVQIYFAFPEPTAWMVYGVFGVSTIFTVFYVIGFRRFIFTHEDEKAFQDLVSKHQQKRGEQ